MPPTGAANPFVQVDDNSWGYSPDQLQTWEFRVDWSNPGSSTFTRAGVLATAAFDANLCGYSRNCIPQPGGVKVDAISDRLMYRLQYRNFGSHQSMLVNHTVDVNGGDRAGIRHVAHTLKSSSASIGALVLSRHCANVESLIRENSSEDLQAPLAALTAELDAVSAAIRTMLESRP